jgi:cytochrome c
MDSFELNKIIGAILGTLLFVMGAGFLAEAIYAPKAVGPGYELPEPEGTGTSEPEVVAEVDIGTLLASANVEQGQASARRCAGCHNFDQGAGNKQGPELFGVVGRPIASHAGFAYSDALKAHSADTWTYENLDHFLKAPAEFAPKTKMNFGGLKDAQERANVIAYLASDSPDAPPFPAPAPAEPAAGDQPDAATPAGEAPAPAGQEAVPTDANAVATPEATATETPVEGTPTTSGTSGTEPAAPATSEPAAPAAEPAPAAPAATPAAPATQPPVTSPAPASN